MLMIGIGLLGIAAPLTFSISIAIACQEPFPVSVANQYAAAQADTAKVVHSRLAGFGIPFKINDPDGKYIEVQLYKSLDGGRNWEFQGRQLTSDTEFPFKTDGEGEYWFAMKTLDRDRRLLPEGDPVPELKVIVDLTRPELEFAINTDRAGRVVCQWQASDQFLNLAATRLQFRSMLSADVADSENGARWQDVVVNPPASVAGGIYSDKIAFWPDTAATQLELRMAVADAAGNVAVAARKTSVQAPAWRASSHATARPTDRPAVDPGQVRRPGSDVRSIKCNDGTCEIKQASPDQSAWKNAFYSKLRRQENRHLNPHDVAAQKVAKPSVQAMLVGSSPEYAAPPAPEGWVVNSPTADGEATSRAVVSQPVLSVNQPPFERASPVSRQWTQPPTAMTASDEDTSWTAPPVPQSHSRPHPRSDPRSTAVTPPASRSFSGDVWESAVQRSDSNTQTSVGTTRMPDHSMRPIASRPGRTSGPSDNVRANPRTLETVGDSMVSSSSTKFPDNQYRGLAQGRPPVNPDAQVAPGVPQTIFQPQPRSASSDSANVRPSDRVKVFNSGFNRAGRSGASGVGSNEPRVVQNNFTTRPASIGRPSGNGPSKSNTQIISTRRFRLSYDINAIDPSGVGKVDLWMTEDQGRSWQLWGNDPDKTSPFPVEVKSEGLFGFRVVIHSRDGLSGVGPSSGDDADMWVRVDTRSPLAQIISVPYGRAKEVGRLVINYRVADPFLTLRPVRISYSRAPQGPWTIIEDNLRNEGRYLWKVDRAVPDRIFLRIEAMDQAGNTGTHILSQAIDVSGLVPRGTIHSVEPVGVR